MPRTPLGRMLARALRRRCPRCGGGGIFSSWGRLVSRCPSCGHSFERESGYWVGALTVNLAVTEIVFGVVFVATMFATLPDIPWLPLLLVALGTNLVLPILFYPYSKTTWMALDLYFDPAPDEKLR